MSDQLIDIGVNLMHRSFDQDRDEVVARALEAGVSPLLLTGTSVRNSEGAARYADKFPGKLFTTAGIHPHCFTGSLQELQVYLQLGFYIGITGWICDERRGKHLRELVKRIPLDRLMLETDAPFLTPRDLPVKPQDGRNEPAFLPHIAATAAACLGKSVEEIAESTTRTAKDFFGLNEFNM